ncbi:hypothetical protein C5C21_14450 [Rathayibacter tritici]|nr:hypothetical protein C5C21_14450 [Rathayibacter tritici]
MAREEVLRQYLREIVPGGYEVSTGFVIDSAGGQSKQQDLIIVRRDYHPRFQIGGALFYPVEAVSAVVEIKSTLTAATLKEAVRNGRSVKELDRTAGGRNYVPAPDGSRYMDAQVITDNHTVQAFVVAAACISRVQTAVKTVCGELTGHERRTWTNGVAVAGSWYLSYEVPEWEPRSFPQMASGMRFFEATDEGNVEPLLDVARDIWWWLRASPIIDADPDAYIRTSTSAKRTELPG